MGKLYQPEIEAASPMPPLVRKPTLLAADAQFTRYNPLCLQPPPWVGTARVYDEVSHLSLPSLEIPTEA